jgi:hypothetical protein
MAQYTPHTQTIEPARRTYPFSNNQDMYSLENYNLVMYNHIQKYKHKEFSLRSGSGIQYLGFYQKNYAYEEYTNKMEPQSKLQLEPGINNNYGIIIYEFLNPYTREISVVPVYRLYAELFISNPQENPRKISEEMKNEIVYHPYHMFINCDIVDFISVKGRTYFKL